MIEAAHGRAPAVATGVKRSRPDKFVFTYQGDGDLAAIGTCETVHAATRGENITIIFINNTIYGMTGGQMAPTTLPGQVTQTTPFGRDPKVAGYPVMVCEMLSQLTGTAYAVQKNKQGFSIIEVLSTCPTNWGMTPLEAMERVRTEMIPYYPLGVYKDITAENK